MQQSTMYKSQLRRRMEGRSQSTNILDHGKTFKEHHGLDHYLSGIKL